MAELGAQTLREFCGQFGDDVYSIQLLTILFEVLFNMPREILERGLDEEDRNS